MVIFTNIIAFWTSTQSSAPFCTKRSSSWSKTQSYWAMFCYPKFCSQEIHFLSFRELDGDGLISFWTSCHGVKMDRSSVQSCRWSRCWNHNQGTSPGCRYTEGFRHVKIFGILARPQRPVEAVDKVSQQDCDGLHCERLSQTDSSSCTKRQELVVCTHGGYLRVIHEPVWDELLGSFIGRWISVDGPLVEEELRFGWEAVPC